MIHRRDPVLGARPFCSHDWKVVSLADEVERRDHAETSRRTEPLVVGDDR
jgi:hypothetical protein